MYKIIGLPNINIDNIPNGVNNYKCPNCNDTPIDDDYIINDVKYPICCNEYLNPDSSVHDWTEIHKCKSCGNLFKINNGYF